MQDQRAEEEANLTQQPPLGVSGGPAWDRSGGRGQGGDGGREGPVENHRGGRDEDRGSGPEEGGEEIGRIAHSSATRGFRGCPGRCRGEVVA